MKNQVLEIMTLQNGMVPFKQYYSTSNLASQLKDSIANDVDLTAFVALFPMTPAARQHGQSTNPPAD
jgi:hypothetical protein